MTDPRHALLRAAFDDAVKAVSAPAFLPPLLPPETGRPMTLFALGKAGAAMAAIACRERAIARGLVVTRRGHVPPDAVFPQSVRVIEAEHPMPGETGMAAARSAMALARSLGPDDHLLALVSGGGSALLPMPVAGLSLADKQAITAALLRSGAPIADINRVRRALSAIKGGKLAAATSARVTTIVLSDIPGDTLADVASGPTIAPGESPEAVDAIFGRWNMKVPPHVATVLARGREPSAPRPRDRAMLGAGADLALAAAARRLSHAGYRVIDLGSTMTGSVESIASRHAALIATIDRDTRVAILSGGEADVAVPADAPPGGRNGAFLVELAHRIDHPGVAMLACDTDGIDGTSQAAGGSIDERFVARIAADPQAARSAIAAGRASALIECYGTPIVTGPTYTNVNDFRAILLN